MAIFSNLEGTMKKSFILGKNGAQFTTNGSVVQVQDYKGTKLLPVSAADPVANSHLVTLGYFNSHSGGGSGGILRGTNAPSDSLGIDGDVYFLVDATNILQIYIKDLGIWKPMKSSGPGTDSDYVTSFTVPISSFTLIPGTTDEYTYSISSDVHGRGADILVQLQGEPGGSVLDTSVIQTDVELSGLGDITVRMIGLPTDLQDIKINIIGATTMTTPYGHEVNSADWVASGGKFTITVPASTHNQSPNTLYVAIYANDVPGSTALAPFDLVSVETQIDSLGNVTFTSDEVFSGKYVISGK